MILYICERIHTYNPLADSLLSNVSLQIPLHCTTTNTIITTPYNTNNSIQTYTPPYVHINNTVIYLRIYILYLPARYFRGMVPPKSR